MIPKTILIEGTDRKLLARIDDIKGIFAYGRDEGVSVYVNDYHVFINMKDKEADNLIKRFKQLVENSDKLEEKEKDNGSRTD